MTSFVEVALNLPQVKDVYHYHLPESLEGQVDIGHLVEVPFGRQQAQGVVLRFIDEPAVPQTRPVLGLVDPQAVITPTQFALAQRLAYETLSPLGAYIQLLLPPGLGQQVDTLYSLNPRRSASAGRNLSDLQSRLLALLQRRGPLRGRQIETALPHFDWRPALRSLARRGVVLTQSVLLPPSVRPKSITTARLAVPPEIARQRLSEVGRSGSAALKRRQAMLNYLMQEVGPVEAAWLYAECGGSRADLQKLADLGLVVLGESEAWRDPLGMMELQPVEPPVLTSDQQRCWEEVEAALREAADGKSGKPFLLHGVTGSGKTEIYLKAVDFTLRQGKQAIVLVPEIALTPQTVHRFLARFPGQVGLVHSGLSPGERYDTWRRARLGALGVVVGPRSALFSPLPDLGLVVVDECHDDSYFQDAVPFYHARLAAVIYAQLAGAVCLMGSATPDITSAYQAAQGQWNYLRLPARILAHRQMVQIHAERLGQPLLYRPLEGLAETIDLPPVEVVDMRQELQRGNRSIFSQALQDGLTQVLEKGLQAILFLNRRGTATYVFCRDCGYVLKCPRCDTPLTYHSPQEALTCHSCGYQRKMPDTCPSCKSKRIRQYGMGTERVEAEVQALYPQAHTLRWDYDTTRKKGAHEVILSHFTSGRANVLIGTQMLAKGLDLPLVTLVGVVLADVGLNLPDYRASERTFQVLTQVAGRAGRSPLGGQVILQTFQPEHYAIRAAAKHSFRDFYRRELDYRRELHYPPFTHLVRLEFRHVRSGEAEAAASKMADRLRGWIEADGRRETDIIGPAPCFFSRQAGYYRWQIVLRGPDPASLLRAQNLPDWQIEVDPPSLL
jgi:primosomal protein N' (replication factor Y)